LNRLTRRGVREFGNAVRIEAATLGVRVACALQNVPGESGRGRMRALHGGPGTFFAVATLTVGATALAGCDRHDAARTARLASTDPRQASSESAYEVATAQAEGAHRVAVERCATRGGDTRRICLERADADLARARAAARDARDGATTR
jgi:hypothetical protein